MRILEANKVVYCITLCVKLNLRILKYYVLNKDYENSTLRFILFMTGPVVELDRNRLIVDFIWYRPYYMQLQQF